MAKKVFSFRLETAEVEALEAYASGHGISRAEALEAAIRSLDHDVPSGANQTPQEAAEGQERPETHTDELRAVIDVLRASNADLRAEVSRLWSQLATKDEQINSLTGLADHAQKLHAAEVTRALPAEGRRPSLWERLTGRERG